MSLHEPQEKQQHASCNTRLSPCLENQKEKICNIKIKKNCVQKTIENSELVENELDTWIENRKEKTDYDLKLNTIARRPIFPDEETEERNKL